MIYDLEYTLTFHRPGVEPWICGLLKQFRPNSVLDAGCGLGLWGLILKGYLGCSHVVGVDAERQGSIYYSLIGEESSFKLFKELVKPPMTFLDVGAGVGSYSIPAAKRGLRVIAIEPDPISFRLLLKNAKLNGVKLETFNLAAYDKKCKLTIQPYVSLRKETSKIVVEAMPIDYLEILEITADVVKIDVDGAEIEVLRGGLNTLRMAKWIFIELRPSTLGEALRILKGLNKRGSFIEHLCTSGLGLLIRPRTKSSDFMLLFS
jgi:FkbM family methyltransferase